MKYIRTYGDYNSWKLDYSNPDRGFRLKPTLYKYSDVGIESNILLENDDPRKHGDSTYMEITLDSDVEFSFYIGNAPDDTQTTMNCSVDWSDGTVETKTITADDKGFKLSHNYKAGGYIIELYDVERDYSMIGVYNTSLISPIDSVKRVVLGEGNNYGVGGVVNIGLKAFLGCSSLTSIHIPNGVTSIGDVAFQNCSLLTSINIPEGVTSIGSSVFRNCSSLTSINIPEGVTSIGSSVFRNCSSLTSINIPEGVTSIGEYAFNGCYSLTSISISEGVTSIGEGAFAGTPLTSISIPEGVTSIGDVAFQNCSSLTSVNLPSTLVSIGSSMFEDCSSLTSVNLPSTLTSIGGYAFSGLGSLTSINLPSTLTSIGEYAFQNCTSLSSINIPENVTSIGEYAFFYCSSLNSIYLYNITAPTLGSNVFKSIPTNGTLHIKPGATGYDAWMSQLPSSWIIVEDL